MRWLVGFLVVLAAICGQPAYAADDIRYGPIPAWVMPIAIPVDQPSPGGSAQVLLVNKQSYFGEGAPETYYETAFKVLTVQGLQELGTLVTAWDPAIQTTMINKASIIRDGREIDLLANGAKFATLRREANLSNAILDGNLTAILEVKDLRVGDVVRLATSTIYEDSVLGNHAEATEMLTHPGKVGRFVHRKVWTKSRPIRWRATPQFGEIKLTETDRETELLFDHTDVEAPQPPSDAPPRFAVPARLELTDFKDWSDLATVMAPLFEAAAVLPAGSPLHAEVEKIKATHQTPEARALAALQLVETEVRYLAVTMGNGGLRPVSADATWSSRFGDCKAKTALLVALLQELGIKAQAALVSSNGGDGLNERLPQASAFDHVIVRAEIGGKIYWLDGTRVGDRSLTSDSGTPFRWTLPLKTAGAALEKPARVRASRPLVEQLTEIDASRGFDVDGPSRVRVIYRGEGAQGLDLVLSSMTKDVASAALKERWADAMTWLTVEATEFGWDEGLDGYRIEFKGHGKADWMQQGGVRTLSLDSSFASDISARPAGPQSDAPFAIDFPFYSLEANRIRLPNNGAGFEVVGADVDMTAGNVEVKRTAKISDGVAIVETHIQALASETPAAEAIASAKVFADSAIKKDVLVRTGSGPADSAQAQAANMLRLARENLTANNRVEALRYLDRAVRLDPKNTEVYKLRASIHMADGKPALALKDVQTMGRFDASLSSPALEGMALLQLGRYRETLGRAEAILKAQPGFSQGLYLKASALAGLGRNTDMIATMDMLLATREADSAEIGLTSVHAILRAKPEKAQTTLVRDLQAEPQSLAARLMYADLLAKDDPKAAFAQYEQALLIVPDSELALRHRSRVYIGLKDYEPALADLDRLLVLYPKAYPLLLARADVQSHLKRHDKAITDIDAAKRLVPNNPTVLNASCWTRATANAELERALEDCTKALELRPNFANASDSRGLVLLRLNRPAEAIVDYDKALISEESSMSLFGRGLAKRKHGDIAGAEADLAKAVQLDPEVGKTYAEFGLTPDDN